jgi:cell division transport system ATP-binding protein
VIRHENVSKSYPTSTRPTLDGVDVEIEKGEFVFLVGSSGSGKSTFLRLLLKEDSPSTGRVHVLGKDLARLSPWKVPALRRQIGCVFQDFRLLPNKTVTQNVAFALEVIGKPRSTIDKVVPEVLQLVGLEGKGGRMDALSDAASRIATAGQASAPAALTMRTCAERSALESLTRDSQPAESKTS